MYIYIIILYSIAIADIISRLGIPQARKFALRHRPFTPRKLGLSGKRWVRLAVRLWRSLKGDGFLCGRLDAFNPAYPTRNSDSLSKAGIWQTEYTHWHYIYIYLYIIYWPFFTEHLTWNPQMMVTDKVRCVGGAYITLVGFLHNHWVVWVDDLRQLTTLHGFPVSFHPKTLKPRPWGFCDLEDYQNGGTPKSSIYIDGFSIYILNHPFLGTHGLGNPHWTTILAADVQPQVMFHHL